MQRKAIVLNGAGLVGETSAGEGIDLSAFRGSGLIIRISFLKDCSASFLGHAYILYATGVYWDEWSDYDSFNPSYHTDSIDCCLRPC
ncbi:hypothetical protein BLNAU_24109 [Blattamonas nauphoetae]|uniref:Uncharacterized protein n=1 Tax=Blattamonas nauphoetae TaxID=2049346 RepID=A0ABQ9WQD5_9EUKA|nr:hypothetical protein BLNAU_24109 [Blattamonas nauphoetae]